MIEISQHEFENIVAKAIDAIPEKYFKLIQNVVFVKQGKAYKAQKVVTGIASKNLVQITGGLKITDSVAANAQFLMDSESFIKVKE